MEPSVSEPVTRDLKIHSMALTTLSVIAVLYTLYFARAILIPIAIAMLLYLLFAPLVRKLGRFGIPRSLSAAAVIALLVGTLVGTGNYLADPAKEWLTQAPTSLRQAAREFEQVKKPLEGIKELSEEVDEITELNGNKPKPPSVEITTPSALDRVMAGVPTFLMSVAITLFSAFFLLSSGEEQSRRILTFGRSWKAKRRIIRISREIQTEISRHLRTVTLINIALGISVSVALWFLEVPNPILWGTMVAILNFAPYVGAVVSTVVLLVVGMTMSPSLAEALVIPAVFVCLNALEGALITPLVLGSRLSLRPLVVFLSVVIMGWLWGVAGALIAVPLFSSLKVILSHSRSTRPLASLMSS